MLITDWLSDHPQYCATLAGWLHRQFPYEFSQQPLEDWQAEFSAGQHNGEWRMRVALQDGEPVGCAGLAKDDLPQRPELSPWLACVYVRPEARGQGLAERLIEEVCAEARALGHTRLYLHTQDRADYYARRGWQRLDSFTAWGMTHQLMCRLL